MPIGAPLYLSHEPLLAYRAIEDVGSPANCTAVTVQQARPVRFRLAADDFFVGGLQLRGCARWQFLSRRCGKASKSSLPKSAAGAPGPIGSTCAFRPGVSAPLTRTPSTNCWLPALRCGWRFLARSPRAVATQGLDTLAPDAAPPGSSRFLPPPSGLKSQWLTSTAPFATSEA